MIPWYYAVVAFFLGGFAMFMVWGWCTVMSKPTPKPRGPDRRKHVRGRWAYPERRKQ